MGAKAAIGTLWQRKNPATGVFQTIPGCKDITGPEDSRDVIDVTAHDSPNNREEIIASIKRSGKVSTSLNYDPGNAVHQGIRADYEAGLARDYKIIMTDTGAAEIAFSGFVVDFKFSFPVGGENKVAFSVKPSGDMVLTY
jgi:predicted secreted protein